MVDSSGTWSTLFEVFSFRCGFAFFFVSRFRSAWFALKFLRGTSRTSNPNLRRCWGVVTPRRREQGSSVLVGASWAEEGTLVSRCSPRWRSHWLRHPEMTGACLDGIYNYCCCPTQVQCTAFMEGGALGSVRCPFILFLGVPSRACGFSGVPRVEVANIAEERTSWKSHRETGIEPGDVVRGV